MLKLHVIWYNGYGNELSAEPVADMDEARQYIIKLCSDSTLEPGDTLSIKELVV